MKYYYPAPEAPVVDVEADIIVYGATSGGVVAAVQARRMGKSVALVAFRRTVGGMTSGGLSRTDGVDANVQGGIAREFFDRAGNIGFRPSTAERVFNELLEEPVSGAPQPDPVPVYYEQRLASVEMDGQRIVALHMENGSVFRGKMFIDCTYEGDLMAGAGVSYTYGREPYSRFGESRAGKKSPATLQGVDPYIEEGVPESGLIYNLIDEPFGFQGLGDRHIQAYNFRMFTVRRSNPAEKQPLFEPDAYDPDRFEILYRFHRAGGSTNLRIDYDVNNHHFFNRGVASDHIGGNRWPAEDGGWLPWAKDTRDDFIPWPEADYETREKMFQSHVAWQLGMFWYIRTDPRYRALAQDPELSASVRGNIQNLLNTVDEMGLPLGEYPETNGWTHELYVREARRMVSDMVVHQGHYDRDIVVPDPVGLANYQADSHHVRRIVSSSGTVLSEGDTGGGVDTPWRIPYRAIVPKRGEAENLFVPWAISSSHVAFGSMRMEPCFMVLAQSAATAASLCIEQGESVQDLDYAVLRQRLLADGQILGEFDGPFVEMAAPVIDLLTQPDASDVLEASVTPGSEPITKVEFFHRERLLGEVTEPPYEWPLPSELYSGWNDFSARATDGAGRTNNESVFLFHGTPDEVATDPFAGIIIDNSDAAQVTLSGQWFSSSSVEGHFGGAYIHDGNTGGGKSARYEPVLPEPGYYQVYVGWMPHNLRATNAPLDIEHAHGTTTLLINQRLHEQYWTFAGRYFFDGQGGEAVVWRNDGANQHVIADAVAFVPVGAPGSFLRWRHQWFGASALDDAVSGPLAKSAGSGILNVIAYALGLDPTASAGHDGLPRAGRFSEDGTAYAALEYTRDPGATDVQIVAESAATLDADAWTGDGVVDELVGADGPLELRRARIALDDVPRFLRLRIDLLTE
ncbi:MAG: FAD-dependent oxidoreductase [Opitutales bacterium]|nr:FAD-dependent oxidoreductase [Opitutales bacterium]